MKAFNTLLLLTVLLAPAFWATGCSSAQANEMKMAPMSMLPAQMQNAPTRVREAYQFAVANPDALKNVPCYCGCGAIGHTSNYACYIKAAKSDGTYVFDEHALGCSLCVDITQEVMRLSKEGKSPGAVRAQIVSTFSKFGPPNQ